MKINLKTGKANKNENQIVIENGKKNEKENGTKYEIENGKE